MSAHRPLLLERERARQHVREAAAPYYRGRVENVSGVLVEATGVPAAIGELCRIRCGPAQVHGLPHGSPEEIEKAMAYLNNFEEGGWRRARQS